MPSPLCVAGHFRLIRRERHIDERLDLGASHQRPSDGSRDRVRLPPRRRWASRRCTSSQARRGSGGRSTAESGRTRASGPDPRPRGGRCWPALRSGRASSGEASLEYNPDWYDALGRVRTTHHMLGFPYIFQTFSKTPSLGTRSPFQDKTTLDVGQLDGLPCYTRVADSRKPLVARRP